MLLFFYAFIGLLSACCLQASSAARSAPTQGRGDEILRSYAAHELPLLRNSYLVIRNSNGFFQSPDYSVFKTVCMLDLPIPKG